MSAKGIAGWFAFFLAVALALQWVDGAYSSEFGGEPDEAAHYVTGLMVHDYLAAGLPGNPLRYAENYYAHYPKVALGHWPPGFYVAQAAWTLVFTPGRASVLALMAVLAAMTATLLFALIQAEFGRWLALAGTLAFLLMPIVQQFYGDVMTEIPLALLFLLATIYHARFIATGSKWDSFWFGLCASAAILTKTSGLCLALLPVFSLLMLRRWSWLRSWAFWWSAVVVVVLCGPWTVLNLKNAGKGLLTEQSNWAYLKQAVPFYFIKLYVVAGAPIALLALVGFVTKMFGINSNERRPFWVAAASFLAGFFVLTVTIQSGLEARYWIPALPVVVLFAVAGFKRLVVWLTEHRVRRRTALRMAGGLIVICFAVETVRFPHKGYAGFGAVAEKVLQDAPAKTARYLVSSDARGEGMFIAEMAVREKRPGHTVERATKKLANSDWSGFGYQLTYRKKQTDTSGTPYHDARELSDLLAADGIEYIVLDESMPAKSRPAHEQMLADALALGSSAYSLQATFPLERAGGFFPKALKVYQLKRINQ